MKKIIKSSISILLCAVMMFGAAPLSGFKNINLSGAFGKIADWIDGLKLSTSASALESSGQCGENVYWTFDESTGTLTISGEGDMVNYNSRGNVSPFRADSTIKTVVINNGVTNIGNYMFWSCTNLTNITIPDSVTTIGGYVFYNCTSLTGVSIPESVTSIGSYTFYKCACLTNITIPDGVKYIYNNTFLIVQDLQV